MEKVSGIGGVFFRAHDPQAIGQWYAKHLGIALTPSNYEEAPWWQEAGPTVFAPFADDSKFFGNHEQSWMINFRVDDLDAMVAQLLAASVDVEVDPQEYPNGRFARLSDPEGNPIQLWEPKGNCSR